MHPAHEAFSRWLHGKRFACVGQLWIGIGDTFELRHEKDREEPAAALESQSGPLAARVVATYTDGGAFRPLRSAPNLRRGWRIGGLDFAGLVTALDCFYPAALVYWHAAHSGDPRPTSYRECAGRQTGMYRITAKLDDDQVSRVAACCCNSSECLKRPLWRVDAKGSLGLRKPATEGADRIEILCREPCSLFLSFARKAVRLEQEELMKVEFSRSDLELVGEVLRSVLDGTESKCREGDYGDPRHRQRIAYFLKKHEALLAPRRSAEGASEE